MSCPKWSYRTYSQCSAQTKGGSVTKKQQKWSRIGDWFSLVSWYGWRSFSCLLKGLMEGNYLIFHVHLMGNPLQWSLGRNERIENVLVFDKRMTYLTVPQPLLWAATVRATLPSRRTVRATRHNGNMPRVADGKTRWVLVKDKNWVINHSR